MITSGKNKWLKDMRRLRTSKGRRDLEHLLLEGPHLVGEAAATGLGLEAVLATPEFLAGPAAPPLLERLDRPPLEVEASLLEEISDADSPRGVAALARRRWSALGDLAPHPGAVFVYADGLQDPGNMGALARVAEAAGAEALLLGPGSVTPNHPRALRASAGSLLRLPTVPSALPAEVAAHLDATWHALATRGGSSLYGSTEPELRGRARILAVGAEGAGLSPAVECQAAVRLTIPLAGHVESLNATVAAAVVLFEWRRRAPLHDRLG